MSDKDVIEGMNIFSEWHKNAMEQSVEATTWKIPLECIPKKEPKKVWLTVEEAKVIEELALLCLFLRPKAVTIEKAKVMKELNNRIEQAEKGDE